MLKITTLDEAIGNEPQKVVLYSDAGAGKTTAVGTLPGRKLLISAEKGAKSLGRLPKEMRDLVQVVEVRTIAGLREVYDEVKAGRVQCDWIALDSISEIAEIALAEYKKNGVLQGRNMNKDPRAAYGAVEDDVMHMLWDFQALPVNVLFLCKEQVKPRQINEETTIDYFNLLMPGQTLTARVCHLVDELWRLTVRGDKRVLIAQADGRSRAKSRAGLPKTVDVSDGFADVIEMLTAGGDQ